MEIFHTLKKQIFSNIPQEINNEIYNEYGDKWYKADNDPVAILRQESILKCKYINDKIYKMYGDKKIKILDMGCGGGLISNHLAELGHEVHALDISKSSIEVAKKYDKTKSVKYIHCSAYDTPYEAESFDLVLAMDMLEHVEEPEQVTAEASRLLKPDGLYFYHTFNKNLLTYLVVIKFVDWFCPNAHENMHIYRLFIRPEVLRQQCEKHELYNLETIGSAPCLFSWSFIKSILTQRVDKNFKFKFCKNTLLGYLGYAKKGTHLSSTKCM